MNHNKSTPMKKCCLLAFQLALVLSYRVSKAEENDVRPYKFSIAEYRYSDGSAGHDVNLRWRRNDTNVWIGAYRDPIFGTQTRTGFDSSISLGGSLLAQPSLQVASHGFVGGSVNLQIGEPWFAVIGWARTNLKPYFNLNFDPNDAVTVGVGWHGEHDRTLSLTLIADDRLHTGQKDWHLYGRWPVSEDLRITFDLLRKTGEGDGGPVRAWGWSATVDFPTWFVRLSRDPKQNFSTLDATRLAVGIRF